MKSATSVLSALLPGVIVPATGLVIPRPQQESTLTVRQSCALPSSYQWTDFGGPLAEPDNGWASLKDFTISTFNGDYVIYGSNYDGTNYGSFGEIVPLPC